MKKRGIEFFQIIIILFIIGTVSYACKKNRFKKTTFLEDLYEFKTVPELQKSITYSENLKDNWEEYAGNKTEVNFENVRTSFKMVASQMERTNFYNLGDVGAIYVFSRFYKSTIDSIGLMELYSDSETFIGSDIGTYKNTQRGVFTIGYLLYAASFEIEKSSEKYIEFVRAHIDYMINAVTDFETSWAVYESNFVKSEGDGVSDSYNIVINRIIHVLEEVVNKRIIKVIEENNPALGVGYYSNQSLSHIKTQMDELKEIYNGEGSQKFNSVYNNLRKKRRKLADKIKDKFSEIIAFGEVLDQDFNFYLDTPADLKTYESLLIELLTYFKIEVQEELDIIITFGDTDGD